MQSNICICNQRFDIARFKPLQLGCKHVLCYTCISNAFEQTEHLPCPFCGQITEAPVENLEIDEELFLQVEFDQTQYKCEAHQNPLQFYCNEDNKILCQNCLNEDPHTGHDIMDLETFKTEHFTKIKELNLSIDKQRVEVGNKINFLKSTVLQIQDFEKKQRDFLQQSVDSIIKKIIRQQAQKQKEVDIKVQQIQEKIEQQKVVLLLKANQEEIEGLIQGQKGEISQEEKEFLQSLIVELDESQINSVQDIEIDWNFELSDETQQQMNAFLLHQEIMRQYMSQLTEQLKDLQLSDVSNTQFP